VSLSLYCNPNISSLIFRNGGGGKKREERRKRGKKREGREGFQHSRYRNFTEEEGKGEGDRELLTPILFLFL